MGVWWWAEAEEKGRAEDAPWSLENGPVGAGEEVGMSRLSLQDVPTLQKQPGWEQLQRGWPR